MTDNLPATRFPWESTPLAVEETVAALQRDFAFAVKMTAIMVRSNNPAFAITVNTDRGQIVPRGQVKFTDGTTVELQDIGMPQIKVPYMTVQDIMAQVWEMAKNLGLELA